jgi:hypothetical protein
MKKHTQIMTEEEKQQLFLTVAPADMHDQIDQWKHSDGMSFFINDQWAGGIAFLENTNYLVGGVKSEHMFSGVWIETWPVLITWAHSVHKELIMYCADERVADLVMRLGGKVKTVHNTRWQVDFSKDYTEQFLQNNDLKSLQV